MNDDEEVGMGAIASLVLLSFSNMETLTNHTLLPQGRRGFIVLELRGRLVCMNYLATSQ